MSKMILDDAVTFEDAMQELEDVVKKLEDGRLPLEEAIASFERGSLLKQHCQKKLTEAQLRVDKIQTTSTGEIALVPFDSPAA